MNKTKKKSYKKKSNYKHVKIDQIVILKNGVYAKRINNGQFRFIKKRSVKPKKKDKKQTAGAKKKIGTVCDSDNECNTKCCPNGVCESSLICKAKPRSKTPEPKTTKVFDRLERFKSLDTTTHPFSKWGPCKYGNTCLRYRTEKGCRYDHPETIDECLNMHDEYKKICPANNPGPGDILFFESGMIDKDGKKILCSESTDKDLKTEISNRYSLCSKARNEWYKKCEQTTDELKRKNHKITIMSMARRAKDCQS